jgi:hypothetical protein
VNDKTKAFPRQVSSWQFECKCCHLYFVTTLSHICICVEYCNLISTVVVNLI